MNYHYGTNFDDALSRSEAEARAENERANDAFILAMARAVKRGKEKATPGTFVDTTAPIRARRILGDVSLSVCGSPAAMCTGTAR